MSGIFTKRKDIERMIVSVEYLQQCCVDLNSLEVGDTVFVHDKNWTVSEVHSDYIPLYRKTTKFIPSISKSDN